MLDRIEDAITRLTEFSDDLAHELRTPITNLTGEAEIILSRSASAQEYQQVLESSLEELNRIYQIIENLIFLARTENPRIDLEKSLIDINHEINVICRFYQAVADDNNIKLVCQGNATIYANLIMFRRMISNILSNALKNTCRGGDIYFECEEISNEFIQITAIDNGVGISPEDLPKIFQRFYKTSNPLKQRLSGAGLGLSIVKSIIDLHQGDISITSEPNKGTCVIMTFPK